MFRSGFRESHFAPARAHLTLVLSVLRAATTDYILRATLIWLTYFTYFYLTSHCQRQRTKDDGAAPLGGHGSRHEATLVAYLSDSISGAPRPRR